MSSSPVSPIIQDSSCRFQIADSPVSDDPLLNQSGSFFKRLLNDRGIDSAQMLSLKFQNLVDFQGLSGIQVGADRLAKAIMEGETIGIVGDFDADGATSTALVSLALEGMGAKKVVFRLPLRQKEGYGFSPPLLESLLESKVTVLMTVDCGIADEEATALAREKGVDVIITDHHLPGKTLPDALCIINPHLTPDEQEISCLAGVGVAFYLMAALRATLVRLNCLDQRYALADLLPLVALGSVADFVPLNQTNRILIAQGIARLRAGQAPLGLLALCDACGVALKNINEGTFSFVLAPKINAAGRLDDMALGVKLLRETHWEKAQGYARTLLTLNSNRQRIESQMRIQADKQLESLRDNNPNLSGTVVYDESFHQGIIGIVAARIKEEYGQPAVVFAQDGSDNLRGSARSVKGINIRDVLDQIDQRVGTSKMRFGGHAMAAGVSMPRELLEPFRQHFSELVQAELVNCDQTIWVDGALDADSFSIDLFRAINRLGPWGMGFARPLFVNLFRVKQSRLIGKQKTHLDFIFEWNEPQESSTRANHLKALYFNPPKSFLKRHWDTKEVMVIYSLESNMTQENPEIRIERLFESVREDERQAIKALNAISQWNQAGFQALCDSVLSLK